MSAPKIAIVGAGMAGLACAAKLAQAGHAATLFDKARGPGGRMSTRRMDTSRGEAAFDHGAQYFTARDPAFTAQVARWADAGVVARWPAAGEEAWVGVPAMNAPLRAMAAAHEVRWSTRIEALSRVENRWRLVGEGADLGLYHALLIALPAEQEAALLRPVDIAMAASADAAPSSPCWTVMAAFETRLPLEQDVLRGAEIIGWAARDSAKPGRGGPESWVLQATPTWSQRHLEDEAERVTHALLQAFAQQQRIALPETLIATAHRWRYARSGGAGLGALWNPALNLGVCGDWLLGPRVECAWLSGTTLAEAATARDKGATERLPAD